MRRRAQKKSNMILYVMIVLIIAIVGILIFWTPEAKAAEVAQQQTNMEDTTLVKEGMTAPDFTVEMIDGQKITLSALKGKVVLVNFFATWCPPCRQELARVQKDLLDRFAGKDFVYIPISRQEKKETVVAFKEKKEYAFNMGLDPDKSIFSKYATNYIPRSFLVDKTGKVVFTLLGYEDADFDVLISKIDELLK